MPPKEKSAKTLQRAEEEGVSPVRGGACYESPLFLNILLCEVKKRNEYVILGRGVVESNLVP